MNTTGKSESPRRGSSLAEAVACLKGGGVVAYPTEGVYGLGCDALDRAAVERLLALKQRDAAKGLIVIGASLLQLEALIHPLSREQRRQLEAGWPGALTWIVPAAADTPHWLTGGRDTLAVRVPDHVLARELCQQFRGPIVSTSANVSGEAAVGDAAAVARLFPQGVDYLLEGTVGGRTGPSEIRDLRSGRILRPGSP